MRASIPSIARLMPGLRLVGLVGFIGLRHSGWLDGALALHAWSGVPTPKRPSTPMTHVGFVWSRCWLKMAQSSPMLK